MPPEKPIVLITGAGSGMGQLAARNMADAGAQIAALDIDESGLAQTAEGRPEITVLPCDVTNASAMQATAKHVETEIGPIDRVFAAAAIMPTGKLLDQDGAEQKPPTHAAVFLGHVTAQQAKLSRL